MRQKYLLHIVLFLLTVFTTLMAGTELVSGGSFLYGTLGIASLWRGIPFSFAFLLFLTVHEFGHYFTAMYHRVKCSLPYYIPIFIPIPSPNIGSFGAIIRIREVPPSRRKYFDIGVAGPLAGFVVALGLLLYGFMDLPPLSQTVMSIHPDYDSRFGGIPTEAEIAGSPGLMTFGGSLLFEGLRWLFSGDPDFPPAFELMHYPFIFAGFLGLFFTALNLLPIGQLDGGHVVYGLLGAKRAGKIARGSVLCLLLLGGLGMFDQAAFTIHPEQSPTEFLSWIIASRLIYLLFVVGVIGLLFPQMDRLRQLLIVALIICFQASASLVWSGLEANPLWLLYAGLAVRVLGVDHPVALDDTPLTTRQKWYGALAILIFILCFSPNPLRLT
jgi:membrane-associated protease RseP (regulator of RpoE activity)